MTRVRRIALALAFGLSTLGALGALRVARADEAKLPFNAYAKAQKGDWLVLRGTVTWTGEKQEYPSEALFRIGRADGGTVLARRHFRSATSAAGHLTLSSTEATPLASVLEPLVWPGDLVGPKWTDEKRTVSGTVFECKKVSFQMKRDGSTDEVTLWLSPQVKAGGVVAATIKNLSPQGRKSTLTTTKLEVAGYGTGATKDWGDMPAKLLDGAIFQVDVAGTACDLPSVPGAKAKAGDWTALRFETVKGDKTEMSAKRLEVTRSDDDVLELAWTEPRADKGALAGKLGFEKKKPLHARIYLEDLVKGASTLDREEASEPLRDQAQADEKKTVGDREFACRKVHFTNLGDTMLSVTLWVSDDAPGGFVAAEVKLNDPAGAGTLTIELAGFGSGDKTEWGKTAAELLKEPAKKKD